MSWSKVTYIRKGLFGLRILVDKSPSWHRDVTAGGRQRNKGKKLRTHILNCNRE